MTVTAAFGFLCKRRIGGATGDTVGAGSEIAEAVALLTLSAQPLVNLWR
jgi:cobalamin synthase